MVLELDKYVAFKNKQVILGNSFDKWAETFQDTFDIFSLFNERELSQLKHAMAYDTYHRTGGVAGHTGFLLTAKLMVVLMMVTLFFQEYNLENYESVKETLKLLLENRENA